MNRFDWQSQLANAYATFPEAKHKPVIGITGNYVEPDCKLGEGYYKSVLKAGGVPVIIPPLADTDAIITTTRSTAAKSLNPDWVASTANAICLNCSSPNWPTTVRFPCWVSAVASRHWPWP